MAELVCVSLMFHEWLHLGFVDFWEDIYKITSQANILAFITCGSYLLWPHLQIWKTNTAFIVVGGILLTAGAGFWLLLYPIYSVGLGEYLMPNFDTGVPKYLLFFQIFWGHTITPAFFVIMLRYIFRSSSKWHLSTPPHRVICKYLIMFCICMIAIHMIYSWLDIVHPAYGILSNFNWNSKFKTSDGSSKFNLNVVLFTTSIIFSILFTCTTYMWWVSKKINAYKFNPHQPNLIAKHN